MRELIRSLWRECRLSAALQRRVTTRWQRLKRRGVAVCTWLLPAFFLGIFGLPFVQFMMKGRPGPEGLLFGITLVSVWIFLLELSVLHGRLHPADERNAVVSFYGGSNWYAGSRAVASAARLALLFFAEFVLFLVSGGGAVLSGGSGWLLIMAGPLVIVGSHLGGVLGLVRLVPGQVVWWSLVGFSLFLFGGFVGTSFGWLTPEFLRGPAALLSRIWPQSYVYEALMRSGVGLDDGVPWLNWVPAVGLCLLIPFAIKRLLAGYLLYRPEADEEAGDEAEFVDEEELPELDFAKQDDLDLLERIGTDEDPIAFRAPRWKDPAVLVARFERRERVLQQYLSEPSFGFLRGLRWSILMIALLGLYRLAVETGRLPISVGAVLGMIAVAILPRLSLAIREVPQALTLGGRPVPMEDIYPCAPLERSRTWLKVGFLRMLIGLPVLGLVLWVAPLERAGMEGLSGQLALGYLTWWALLPLSSAMASQYGQALSGRRFGWVVGWTNGILLLAAAGVWIVSLLAAFLQPWLLAAGLPLAWGLGGLLRLCFVRWVRAGFFELRLRVEG